MKSIDTTFIDLTTLKREPATGSLLVAQPFLSEKWFNRAVIAVIDHDDADGTTGVVLNLPLEATLSDVLEGIHRQDPVTVYCGGPLSQDRLYFIHTLGDEIIPGARCFAPGLWIGGDFDSAIDYVNDGYPVEGHLRFFIGYSGWAKGQLAEELNADTWAVDTNLPDDIHDLLKGSGDSFWHRIVKDLGPHYRSWNFIPQDASAN